MSNIVKYNIYDLKSNERYSVNSNDLLNTILNTSAKSEVDIAIANRINVWWNFPDILNFDYVTYRAYEKALNIVISESYDD